MYQVGEFIHKKFTRGSKLHYSGGAVFQATRVTDCQADLINLDTGVIVTRYLTVIEADLSADRCKARRG